MKRKNLLIAILCISIILAICIVINDDIKMESSNFRNLVNKLENNEFETKTKLLENKVEEYEEVKKQISENQVEISNGKTFSVEKLWIEIGNYATNNELKIDLDFEENDSNNYFTINFKVTGEYKQILSFIEDIEKDPELEFDVKDFKIEKIENKYNSSFYVENIKMENV